MPRYWLRRDVLRRLLLGSVSVSLTGCGTILYPERRGQPGGPIDWKVFALDSIFLLLFVIPGVIAFAVDFSTGAIYLPTWSGSGVPPQGTPVTSIKLPRNQLTPTGIAAAVSRASGREVQLIDGEYVTEELTSVDDMLAATERVVLRERANKSVLRCQSPAG